MANTASKPLRERQGKVINIPMRGIRIKRTEDTRIGKIWLRSCWPQYDGSRKLIME